MNRTPGTDLLEAAMRLEHCLLDVQKDVIHLRARELERPELVRLREVVARLGSTRPARVVTCPDEYLAMWRRYCATKIPDLPRGAVRSLAWEPEVATSVEFLDFVARNIETPTARLLQGLLQSLHRRWPSNAAVADRLHKLVQAYTGPNRVVTKWREGGGMLFYSSGTQTCAIEMLEARRSLEAQIQEWFLSPSSGYVRALVEAALVESLTWSDTDTSLPAERILELVFWEDWDAAGFKKAVNAALLSRTVQQRSALREEVKSRILRDPRLGDPRLPRNENNWLGISQEARAAFVRLLSADDIEFFFEHILPRGSDPHGRKHFWLSFVSSIQKSRPLLCDEDRYRLSRIMKTEANAPRNFGKIIGQTSAFLLDFGDLVVVEFSRPGHAAYIYTRQNANQVIQDFWSNRPFSAATHTGLRVMRLALDRIIHNGAWEYGAADLLARHGVRRG